jgi:hypothetical protein
MLGQIFPCLRTFSLGIGAEAQEQWHTAEYVARSVAPLVQPCDITFDWFGEPIGSNVIYGLWFDEVFF